MRLLEKYKVDLMHFDSTGDTVGTNITPYYDMKGYSRAEVLVASRHLPVTATGSDRTVSVNLYLATNCSGGGAQSMSSATSLLGFSSLSSALGATNYLPEITVRWNTFQGWDKAGGTANSANIKLGVGAAATYNFVDSSAASAVMNYVCAGATAAASCAAAGFIAAFNNTAINTATALTDNFIAEEMSEATLLAVCDVRIRRKDAESTKTLTFQIEGTCTHIKVGYNLFQHLSVPTEMLGEHRYLAVGVCSTDEPSAYAVTLLRERAGDEVRKYGNATALYDNSIGETKDLALAPSNWSKPA
jgi:hypothetical protein